MHYFRLMAAADLREASVRTSGLSSHDGLPPSQSNGRPGTESELLRKQALLQGRKTRIMKAAFMLSVALALVSISVLLLFGSPPQESVSSMKERIGEGLNGGDVQVYTDLLDSVIVC